MKKELIGVLFLIVLVGSVDGANLIYSENFDDQNLSSPPDGTVVARKYGYNIDPPEYSWAEGRGGIGYSFGSGTVAGPWVEWNRQGEWYSDEVYVSFYTRYGYWSGGDGNIKHFYPAFEAINSYVVYSSYGDDSFYSSAVDEGVSATSGTRGWVQGVQNQYDGGWHRYEYWFRLSTGEHKFWYDEDIIVDTRYYINETPFSFGPEVSRLTFGSMDSNTYDNFTRYIDDIEVWDGIPNETLPETPSTPVIQSVSGNLTHGENVTIQGGGFGTKNIAAPQLWDTVDNIASYSGLEEGSIIPTKLDNPVDLTAPWKSNGYSGGIERYCSQSSEQRHQNSDACYKGTNASDEYMEGYSVTNTGVIYLSWWWKTLDDVTYNLDLHSSKYLRVSQSSDIYHLTFSWAHRQHYAANEYHTPVCCCSAWEAIYPTPNRWHFFEAFFNENNKTYFLKQDNVAVTSQWFDYSGCNLSFDYIYRVGWDSAGLEAYSITSWMDDIYVDNTFQHVVIGNANTYASCTHLEVQPLLSWSEGSITFNVNQGSFSDGETAYVFVVDENGNVSSGKQITFSGESNGTQPPVVYATPHVQDYITLQEMLGSVEDYKRGLTPLEQVVANIKKFIWG